MNLPWPTAQTLKQIEAHYERHARLRASHARLLAALTELTTAFAGARPDIAHLLGPAEIAAYDKAMAAIAAAEKLV
jgi:hypothetical protein